MPNILHRSASRRTVGALSNLSSTRALTLRALVLVAACLNPNHALPAAAAAPPTAPPRVFLFDAKYLQEARLRLRRGDTNLAPALAQLETDARKALHNGPFSVMNKQKIPPSGDTRDYMSQTPYFWSTPGTSNGLPYSRHDGERNPEINGISDHRSLDQEEDTVETLALAFYFTSDEVYAEKAAQLLRAFFLEPATLMNPNLQYAQAIIGVNTGRGTGLIESRGLTRVVDSIGLLAGSKAWTETDQKGMQVWFGQVLHWMQESKNGRDEAAAKNNHGTYYDVQTASFALFLGDRTLATDLLKAVRQKRIVLQIEPDGRQPLELVRTKAWSYSVGNLAGLMSLAVLGESAGVDLWRYQTAGGRSISNALDYLAPFALGRQQWPHQQIGGWPPQMLFPLLRQAALKFPDQKYREWVNELPPVKPSDRSMILHPRVTEPLDTNE